MATVRETRRVHRIGDRSCESCALDLERRLERLPGVVEADVSFRSGSLSVTFDDGIASEAAIEEAIDDYGVEHADHRDGDRLISIRERPSLQREALFVALTFLGMITGGLAGLVGAPAILEGGAFAAAYVFGGWYAVKASLQALAHRAIEIDLLMIVAATGALVIGAPFEGAMLLFLFSLSNVLQHYAFGRSRRAIESLIELRPETARIKTDGETHVVPLQEVAIGDVFEVRPGDRLPLDGVVIDGSSSVDESTLTGESIPVAKEPGAEVFGGTINEEGSLDVEVTRLAHESAIARLIHMVEEAQSEKAPTQRLIDRFEQPYVLGVFAMTALAIGLPLFLGAPFTPTFYTAMTLMVAASPCAVVISTPAAVLSAITAGARQGVLFKGGEHVEAASGIRAVAVDKTGTLTEGMTQLDRAVPRPSATVDGIPVTERDLLGIAAAVQAKSEHHLAQATVDAASEAGVEVPDATAFHAVVGRGVRARIEGSHVHIGNVRYFEDASLPSDIEGMSSARAAVDALEAEGFTSVIVVIESDSDASAIGWLAFSDTIRPEAAGMIEALRREGVEHVVMLTGDNERVARHVAEAVGIDAFHAELLPEEKVERVETLVDRFGRVAMVGDGVNDAPALAAANLGVAMGGAGTDVALETADIVLMGDDLSRIPYVIGLGRRTRRTLVMNFAIAFGAIVIMVVAILTAGMPLPLAVIGHEGSTVLVSINGLRLIGSR